MEHIYLLYCWECHHGLGKVTSWTQDSFNADASLMGNYRLIELPKKGIEKKNHPSPGNKLVYSIKLFGLVDIPSIGNVVRIYLPLKIHVPTIFGL